MTKKQPKKKQGGSPPCFFLRLNHSTQLFFRDDRDTKTSRIPVFAGAGVRGVGDQVIRLTGYGACEFSAMILNPGLQSVPVWEGMDGPGNHKGFSGDSGRFSLGQDFRNDQGDFG